MTNDNGSTDAVVIERTLDAPVARIWEMWTQPEHFQAWYGPRGATIPVANMDVRVGGKRQEMTIIIELVIYRDGEPAHASGARSCADES